MSLPSLPVFSSSWSRSAGWVCETLRTEWVPSIHVLPLSFQPSFHARPKQRTTQLTNPNDRALPGSLLYYRISEKCTAEWYNLIRLKASMRLVRQVTQHTHYWTKKCTIWHRDRLQYCNSPVTWGSHPFTTEANSICSPFLKSFILDIASKKWPLLVILY